MSAKSAAMAFARARLKQKRWEEDKQYVKGMLESNYEEYTLDEVAFVLDCSTERVVNLMIEIETDGGW